jgi:uncharacterized protein YlxW (UPF0749 family)
LETRTREHPETSARARSHLQLAFLYVNHRNPQLNYARALQEMESYFSLAPGRAQTDYVQNWLAVLREVGKLQSGMERMQKVNKSLRDEEVGKLQSDLERMQKANKSLRDEVAGLKETIERLKRLDRHMEERRRRTK